LPAHASGFDVEAERPGLHQQSRAFLCVERNGKPPIERPSRSDRDPIRRRGAGGRYQTRPDYNRNAPMVPFPLMPAFA